MDIEETFDIHGKDGPTSRLGANGGARGGWTGIVTGNPRRLSHGNRQDFWDGFLQVREWQSISDFKLPVTLPRSTG
jgi:hypothetical protein